MNSFFRTFSTELNALWHDSGRLLIAVGAPFLYALIYSCCYGAEVVHQVPISVVDSDQTASSRQLIPLIGAGDRVDIRIESSDLCEARQKLLAREIYAIIYIPNGYEKALLSGQSAQITTYIDASNFLIYKEVLEQVTATILTTGAHIETERLILQDFPASALRAEVMPVDYHEVSLYNPRLGYGIFVLPGVLVLILQQTLLIAIGMRGKR